jgi:hypothetical protein
MRLKRAQRPWAIVQVRVGVTARIVAGRVVDDHLPAGLRLDVLRFDAPHLVRTWFASVERVTFVPEHQARRAALPRVARPCPVFESARGLPLYCAGCGHDEAAHAEARARHLLRRAGRPVRFRWRDHVLTEVEIARRVGAFRADPLCAPVVLFGGFEFCSREVWQGLAAARVPLIMPYDRARRGYEERLLAAICDRRACVVTSIASALGLDPTDLDLEWEPRAVLADEVNARVESLRVGGSALDEGTWGRLTDAGVPLASYPGPSSPSEARCSAT